jgi:hypothetical protein
VDCSSAPPPPPPPAPVYRDEFNSRICDAAVDYIGSDGTLDWSPWTWSEIGDDSAPCTGNVLLTEDPEVIDPANYRIKISGNARGVTRQADLAAFPSATLSFTYRRANVNNNNYLSVSVSDNGGDTWTELDRLEGPAADAAYLAASYDITGYISANTAVRFFSQGLGILETIYIDDVQIDDTTAGGPPSTGSPLTLNPTIDTWIEENSPDTSYGSDDQLQTGANAQWKYYRSLLQFDVSSVPAGATVTSATLRLYTTGNFGNTDSNIAVYRVTAPWEETATWNSTGGQPYNPAAEDEPQAVTTVLWTADVWVEWSLPPGLIHEWVDGVSDNYGLILNYEGSKKNQNVRSATREHATADWHPELVIEYTEP